MQAVYMVRPGDDNDELRFSLRSIEANCPWVSEVVTVGHRPRWCRPDLHLEVAADGRSKYQQVRHQVEVVLGHLEISRRWSLWNDDFFCLAPATEPPNWHMGPIEATCRSWRPGAYRGLMAATLRLLRSEGCPTTWLYATHTPMEIESEALGAALDVEARHGARTLTRSLYGNLAQLGGLEVDDVKLTNHHDLPDFDRTWLSTGDVTWFFVAREMARRFPRRSRWEHH